MTKEEKLIEKFTEWARKEKDILAVILVGSYARNSAKKDSDIDLVLITENPKEFLLKNDWIQSLGSVSDIKEENYNYVQARRVFYEDGTEVEFGITTPRWLKTNPADPGTVGVLSGGYKILYDKAGLFEVFAGAKGFSN